MNGYINQTVCLSSIFYIIPVEISRNCDIDTSFEINISVKEKLCLVLKQCASILLTINNLCYDSTVYDASVLLQTSSIFSQELH